MNSRTQGISNADVRGHNRGLVLSTLAERGPLARVELAAATGLVHGTVSGITQGLLAEGLVRVAPVQDRTGQRGRPSERLELDGSHLAIIAVQVLNHEYHTLIADLGGRQLSEEWTRAASAPERSIEALTTQIAAEIDRAVMTAQRLRTEVCAVRVVLPGVVGEHGTRFLGSLDLGWLGEEPGEPLFLDRVYAKTRLPAPRPLAVNDANAATFAEYTRLKREFDGVQLGEPKFGGPEFGGPKLGGPQPGVAELTDLVYLKGDVGFGGGAIVRGALLEGTGRVGFEPGHTRVADVDETCECGQVGCLVLVASSQSVLEAAGLTPLAEAEGQQAAFAALNSLVAQGDAAATAAVARATAGVRQMISTSIMLFGPQLVVIGGYLGDFLDELRTIHPLVASAIGFRGMQGTDALIAGGLGDYAALQGAADSTRHDLLRSGRPTDRSTN